MTVDRGIIKRTYDLVALFVLINVIGMGALGGYLVVTGAIGGDTLRAVGRALRGGPGAVEAKQEQSADASHETSPAAPVRHGSDIDNADPKVQVEIELLRREEERIQVELDQRLKLTNSILLRVENERQAFKQERTEAAQQEQAEMESRRNEGFEKQIEIFETLSPKVAVQHLLAMGDPQEAAKILIALDTERSRKIVEAARRGDDLTQMQAILVQMRNIAGQRSVELDPKTP